jgi:fatty-acyl-CoA synthase
MQGLMQHGALTVDKIIDHAAQWHGGREVVTRSVEGPIVRTTYAAIHDRAKRVSNALLSLGIKPGDRVATLAWNTGRHMEAWYGIMGIGAVCHTLNPRLFPEQIAWIADHAGDRVLFTDLTFLPIVAAILPKVPSIEHVVVFTDGAPHAGLRAGGEAPHFKGVHCFEDPGRAARAPTAPGAASTRARRRGSATPRARRAIPRGCCIRTAPTSCTP